LPYQMHEVMLLLYQRCNDSTLSAAEDRGVGFNVGTELWWNDADGWETGVPVDGHVRRATSAKNLARTGLGSNPGLRPPESLHSCDL
jgi:hypothetical protein